MKSLLASVAVVQVVSLSVNGIRAAVRRGLFGWIADRQPDVICLQEIRATSRQLPSREFEQLGYESVWNLGNRPVYSGVGILSRTRLEPGATPLENPATEHEGRFLAVRVGETVVTNSYVPNGNTGPERLAVKLAHLSALRDWAEDQIKNAEGGYSPATSTSQHNGSTSPDQQTQLGSCPANEKPLPHCSNLDSQTGPVKSIHRDGLFTPKIAGPSPVVR